MRALVFVAAICGAGASSDPTRPLVLSIAGVRVGMETRDADVVSKFGRGCVDPAVPHGGARYFTDGAGTLTLSTIIGVDSTTEVVELREGLHVPATCSGSPLSDGLAKPPAVDRGVRLGMTMEEIRRLLGTPDDSESSEGRRKLIYRTTAEEDPRVSLFYTAWFEFQDDRLVTIAIADGC